MPRAADLYLQGALPATHSPLDRIDFQPPKFTLDLATFIEQWTQFVEDYLFAIIEDLTGIDLSFLLDILDKIKGFIGLGDWTDPFSLPAVILNFIQNVLKPGGVLDLGFLSGLLTGGGGGGGASFPLSFPHGFSDDSPVPVFFRNLLKWLPLDFASGDIGNIAEAAVAFIENLLKPTNLLAWLNLDGILPDELSPKALLDMGQSIIDAFNDLPPIISSGPIGFVVNGVWSVISGLFGGQLFNSAQIAALQTTAGTGTGLFSEEFDGPTGAFPAGWTLTYSGSGSGTWGISGGMTKWTPGSGSVTVMATNGVSASTVTQYAQMILSARITDAVPAEEYLLIRSDTTAANCIRVKVPNSNSGGIQVQAVVAGTPTNIGGAYGTAWPNGAKIEIECDAADDRHYIVKMQGETILDVTEPSAISDIALRKIGVGGKTGSTAFTGAQISPAKLKSATGKDM